jgi:Glycogen recognition site of AMP-activated protein kinase
MNKNTKKLKNMSVKQELPKSSPAKIAAAVPSPVKSEPAPAKTVKTQPVTAAPVKVESAPVMAAAKAAPKLPPAPVTPIVAATPKPEPAKTTLPKVNHVSLELVKPEAKKVFVAGSFNGWRPEKTPLAAIGNGRWVGDLTVNPGRHEYLFVVDDQWVPDPNAKETVQNPFGGKNSVLIVSE